jgi:hypothetical protein
MAMAVEGLGARVGRGPVPGNYVRLVVRTRHFSRLVDAFVTPGSYIDVPAALEKEALRPRSELGGMVAYERCVEAFPTCAPILAVGPTVQRPQVIIIRPLPEPVEKQEIVAAAGAAKQGSSQSKHKGAGKQ